MDKNIKLQEVVEYYTHVIHPEMFAILDTSYKIITIDDTSPTIMRFSKNSLIGKNFLYDISRTPKRAQFVKENMDKCINTMKPVTFLSVIYAREPGYETLIFSYKPLIDKLSHTLIGILIEAQIPKFPINYYSLKKYRFNKTRVTKKVQTRNKIALTVREQEIIFLLFHCDTNDEIAEIISNAHNTKVTAEAIRKSIWRGLYTKFEVQNLLSLKRVAILAQLHNNVPPSLSNELIFQVET